MIINIVKLALTEASKKWRLNARDYLQGLIVAALSSAGGIVVTALSNGGAIDWKAVGLVAISSALGYLLKKLPQGEV